MTIFQSILLGIIQGITEFLPISSSAHLVLTPYLLGWNLPTDQVFIFDVLVQMGTLLAVIIYFRRDLLTIIQAFVGGIVQRQPFVKGEARMGWYLILATIPAGLAGLLVKDQVEEAFNSPLTSAIFLLGTAIMLVLAEFLGKRRRNLGEINWQDTLWMGVGQALAVFPGISRSGATISAGMTRHLERRAAGRFAFLMSIPIMTVAGVYASLDLPEVASISEFLPPLILGILTAAVVGYLSIHWLLRFITHRPLTIFAVYCCVISLITFLVAYVR